MKVLKSLLSAIFLVGALYGFSEAWVREDSYVREAAGEVKFRFNDVTASTSAVLMDLSDAVNFPHRNNGMFAITDIRVAVDKIAASTGTVRLGVVRNVDASSGTISWFYSMDFERDTVRTAIIDEVPLTPGVVRTYVTPTFTTPFLLTNDVTSFSTVYQTDVNLPSATGTPTAPGIGDVILRWDWAGAAPTSINSIDITAEVVYYSER